MSGPFSARLGDAFLWDAWYVGVAAQALPTGSPAALRVLDEPLLIGRDRNGDPYALSASCGRRDAAVADGARPRRYPVVEQQGLIWVWMSLDRATAPDEPPPRFPEIASGRPMLIEQIDYPVHVDHAILGLLDPAHGPFVHRQWWWRRGGSSHAKSKAFVPLDRGFVMLRHRPSRNSHAYAVLGGAPETEIHFQLPGLRWEHVVIGRREVLSLSIMTPLTPSLTRMTQILWSSHPVVTLLQPLARWATRTFLRQDARIMRLQAPGLADHPPMLWVGDADQQARWYLHLKREWIACRREGREFRNPISARTLHWTS
ncbi:Rieske 2Fe-2S domain-containing protein [Phenylobacterium sp.]|uniref:Rieske 2Fe-2S domain-containing protein n=1 Tax=Phenylobacterium sp. TaxID=1871053 RepID=UPI0030027A71